MIYDGSLARVVERYARETVITAHLQEDGLTTPRRTDFADLGEVLDADANQVRLRVPRRDVASAAAALLSRERVADLTIEEPDVGTIIAGILEAREGEGA